MKIQRLLIYLRSTMGRLYGQTACGPLSLALHLNQDEALHFTPAGGLDILAGVV